MDKCMPLRGCQSVYVIICGSAVVGKSSLACLRIGIDKASSLRRLRFRISRGRSSLKECHMQSISFSLCSISTMSAPFRAQSPALSCCFPATPSQRHFDYSAGCGIHNCAYALPVQAPFLSRFTCRGALLRSRRISVRPPPLPSPSLSIVSRILFTCSYT